MVKIETYDNPYGVQIRNFFQTEFPAQMEKTGSDTLELITNAILASGKVRLGPKPSIESQYAIRQTISAKVAAGEPIPFLMPWGSEKPESLQTVDLAEVVALKTLGCLQTRVKSVYSPGIKVRIRVENATAPSLFEHNKSQARVDAEIYTTSLLALNNVLGTDFVHMVPESSLVTEARFQSVLDTLVPVFEEYLLRTRYYADEAMSITSSYEHLKNLGWSGIIPKAQRDHYLNTYRKLYGMDDKTAYHTLAVYFAQSLARRKLNMLGNLDWTDYLGLSFVGPIPGEPQGVAPKRVYYRTIPENMSSFHIAPWRGKGYFAIGDGLPRVRLSSWFERRSYNQATILLQNGSDSVSVRTDYEVL